MSSKNPISRREFIKDAALAGAAVAAATVLNANPAAAAPIPAKWDKETDVLIVGFGGAGASAALSALEAGAKVLIIEKAPQGEEGGNTRVSGNLFFNPTPADKAITYFKAMSAGMTVPEDMIKVWADEMGKNVDWVKSIGGNPALAEPQSAFCSPEFPELPGSDSSKTYFGTPGGWAQERLWKVLKAAVDGKKIEVLYATPAKELVQKPDTKEIVGVMAEQGAKSLSIKANRAVVLTCGGYENNPQMMRDYNAMPDIAPFGTPHNTGDGIKMALRVGADLWHMSAQSGMMFGFRIPGNDYGILSLANNTLMVDGKPQAGFIWVDGDGNRFLNENGRANHGYVKLNAVWRPNPMPIPAFEIMDDKARPVSPVFAYGQIMGWSAIVKKNTFSKDNSQEVDKGYLVKADTLADLAAKIKIDPKNLEATVTKWNDACAKGADAEYGRAANYLGPIKQAPFYAMRLTPCLLNTQGGPKRNVKAQIVDVDDKPIPRLYSAGELGSIYPFLYNGGGNVGECLAFGRIAGKNAAAEKPQASA